MKIPKHHLPHIEALTQNVIGMIIAFIILKIFGMSFTESVLLQSIFFITSYIRSYAIRKLFKNIIQED